MNVGLGMNVVSFLWFGSFGFVQCIHICLCLVLSLNSVLCYYTVWSVAAVCVFDSMI